MDDVNDSYPPGTVVFWSLSTTPDGTAEISWFRKGFRNFDKVSVPGGCKCTVSSDGGVVAIAWTAGTDPISYPISFAIVGPFIRELHAQEFAGRAGLMLEDPSAWLDERWDTNLGWRISKPVVTLDDATATAEHVYDSLTITKTRFEELVEIERRYRDLVDADTLEPDPHAADLADARRYRDLVAGHDINDCILVNAGRWRELVKREKERLDPAKVPITRSTFENLATESAKLHKLLAGQTVDGSRLVDVGRFHRLERFEGALRAILGAISDGCTDPDLDYLGFELNTD